eukprot:10010243-Heterocapsa_arctica.AAC.1
MDIKVISVVVEAIVRSSKRPNALREAGVNHASAGALKDVKVLSLNHGIALRNTGATRLVENAHLFTGTDDLVRAVRVYTLNIIIASEVPESRDSVLK